MIIFTSAEIHPKMSIFDECTLSTERPLGNPMCTVQSVNDTELQYQCQWLAGSPPAQLSFPVLSNASRGAGFLSLNVTAVNTLDGKTVTCVADHPVERNNCNITARKSWTLNYVFEVYPWLTMDILFLPGSPANFLPAVGTTVDCEDKIVVSISCVSEASPRAVVLWTDGSKEVTNGTTYLILNGATQLNIHHYNVNSFFLHNYTCVCSNPLGSRAKQTQLKGMLIQLV